MPSVPRWAHKWIKHSYMELSPDWDVLVISSDESSEMQAASIAGCVEYRPEYYQAVITLSPDLRDDEDGHCTIVHEFCHVFNAGYVELADNIAALCLKGEREYAKRDMFEAVGELKRQSDERQATKLARIMYPYIKAKYGLAD